MSTASGSDAALERLSALVDGEVAAADAADVCSCWRDDRQVRASWHVYHLIGDVLRSDDLAFEPARDAAMLAALRTRLAAEPVVLAPVHPGSNTVGSWPAAPADRRAGHGGRFPWVVSSAVAAGFVAVIGAFSVLRQPAPSVTPAATLAAASGQPTSAPPSDGRRVGEVASDNNPARPAAFVAAGVVRDPRLDAYLAAHKQFAGSTALGVPSAFLRSATVETTGR